jgi:hypothetical protein
MFAFYPKRCAVLLVGGNKCGNWKGWYDEAIPEAERRYEEHLNAVEDSDTEGRKGKAR